MDKLNKKLAQESHVDHPMENEAEIVETVKILDSAQDQLVKHEKNLAEIKKEIDQFENNSKTQSQSGLSVCAHGLNHVVKYFLIIV